MDRQRKNVLVLSSCQALQVTNNVTLIAVNGLAGLALASSPRLSTLPVTAFVVGGALFTLPASLLMQRVGRQRGFTIGALLAVIGSVLCALAVHERSFWLLCAGNVVTGASNACATYYRFAAADAAPEDGRERAISTVLAGGLAGGILGPEASKLTKDLLPEAFLGTYLSLIALALIALGLFRLLDIPPLSRAEQAEPGRPLSVIVRQPKLIVAVLGAVVGYAVMNLLMTATPLAMQMCHHPYDDAALVIEWHVIGMFAPSFVTGSLIRRFGVLEVMLAGTALLFACVAIAVSGVTLPHFFVSLVLLGIGWNFLFVGGTTLLTETYEPSERGKTQGLNDAIVFAVMGVSSAAAGLLVTDRGWEMVNYASLPFLLLVGAAIVMLRVTRGRAAAGA